MVDENLLYAQLKSAATEGERTQWRGELIQALQTHAAAVCVKQLGSVRSDLVDAAVFQAVRGLDSFRGESKFSTWFHRIAINTCLDWRKWYSRRREVDLGAVAEPLIEIESALLPRIELEQLMRDLSVEDRDLIAMKLDGQSDTEIAQRLKLTREGVKSQWKRLRRRLAS
jgi:RNA polymerase sigma-70 factor (ECF subfamily)